MAVTIRQVANKAGVSTGTVSRVLNNKSGVGDETRKRVLDTARTLNYTIPKRSNMTHSEITHLGLLNRPVAEDGLMSNPFYHDIFLGVEHVCQTHQINLSFNTLDMANIANKHLRSRPSLLQNENLQGLVLVGALAYEIVSTLTGSTSSPAVLVDNWFEGSCWDGVMIDNEHGMTLMTEHVIAHGHRHIALMNGPSRPSVVERCIGYQKVIQAHNLTPCIVYPPDLMPENAERYVLQILQQAPETTAFMCSNDLQAIATIKKLQELGYTVPGDFSVTGFDDISMAHYTSPPLTTIHVDQVAFGQIAVEMLIERIKYPNRPPVKSVMGVKVIERDSVCAARPKQAA